MSFAFVSSLCYPTSSTYSCYCSFSSSSSFTSAPPSSSLPFVPRSLPTTTPVHPCRPHLHLPCIRAQYRPDHFKPDFSGNTWKPESEQMGSTDTPDFFPEGYDPKNAISFTEGMRGSQDLLIKKGGAVDLPGLENIGKNATVIEGLKIDGIPPGMVFKAPTFCDGEFEIDVNAASSRPETMELDIEPFTMGFVTFYVQFTPESHPAFSVTPVTGRMERRGGKPTSLKVSINPKGQSGDLVGHLVLQTDANDKLYYMITAHSK